MNVQTATTGQTRLLLSALADRLVFGDPDTFDPADARELASLMPPSSWSARWLGDWVPEFRVKGEMPGSSSAGFAAGVGNVSVGGDRLTFDLDSHGRRIVRAGQWKLSWSGQSIQIEQVMADNLEDGRTALVKFRGGAPIGMDLLATTDMTIGVFTFTRAVFNPWKTLRPE
jgi:hypothetical protein